MSMESTVDSPTARVTRILDGTPEDVFAAWTDPEQARHWMCPAGGTVPELTLEARVGGRLRLVMHVNGKDFVHLGEFLEVERPRRPTGPRGKEERHGRDPAPTDHQRPAGDRLRRHREAGGDQPLVDRRLHLRVHCRLSRRMTLHHDTIVS